MALEGFAGPIVFAGSTILMFLLVPWQRIKELAVIGTVLGFGVALLLIYFMQNLLNIWVFHQVEPTMIRNIPLFLSLAWVPAVIAFAHLLAQYKSIVLVGLLLIAFPVAATVVHWILLATGLLTYNNWNLILTFLVSLGIHIGIMAYLYITNRLENLREIEI